MAKRVLRAPNPNRPHILQSDASVVAVGAALSQIDDAGLEYVIGYTSRKLLPRERNYSVVELECLAIVTGVRKFEHYIYGKMVTVQTDQKTLEFLHNMANANPRLCRWS